MPLYSFLRSGEGFQPNVNDDLVFTKGTITRPWPCNGQRVTSKETWSNEAFFGKTCVVALQAKETSVLTCDLAATPSTLEPARDVVR